jgi:signal transduction histidine kinase
MYARSCVSDLQRSGRHALDADEEFPTETIPVITEPDNVRESSWVAPIVVLAVLGVVGAGALVLYRSDTVLIGVACGWVVATALVLYWGSRVRGSTEAFGRSAAEAELREVVYELTQAQRKLVTLERARQDLRAGLADVDGAARARQVQYAELLRDLVDQTANRWPVAPPPEQQVGQVLAAGSGPDEDPVVAGIGRLRELLGGLAVPVVRSEVGFGPAPEPGFARVLVNVGRRTQDFAHRAIEELDELIHKISDPALLRYLWAIDHLLSRLRRVSENLILIEGPTAPRQWRQPVTLLSALRQAKAEIDNYERVQLLRPIPGTVLGHVVVPLAHLVAELLENAANYSKPESPIKLSARQVTAGIAVSVDDEGFGMPDGTLDRANDLLNSDIDVDTLVQEGRLVGLWVVAHIARMYGMRVELSRNIFGGTTASIVIPPTLIHEPEEVAAAAPAAAAVETIETKAVAEPVVAPAPVIEPVAPVVAEPEPEPVAVYAEPAGWPTESPDVPGSEESVADDGLPPLPKRPPGTQSMVAQLRSPNTAAPPAAAPTTPPASAAMANFLMATQAIRADGTDSGERPDSVDDVDDAAQPGDSQGDPQHNAR